MYVLCSNVRVSSVNIVAGGVVGIALFGYQLTQVGLFTLGSILMVKNLKDFWKC